MTSEPTVAHRISRLPADAGLHVLLGDAGGVPAKSLQRGEVGLEDRLDSTIWNSMPRLRANACASSMLPLDEYIEASPGM